MPYEFRQCNRFALGDHWRRMQYLMMQHLEQWREEYHRVTVLGRCSYVWVLSAQCDGAPRDSSRLQMKPWRLFARCKDESFLLVKCSVNEERFRRFRKTSDVNAGKYVNVAIVCVGRQDIGGSEGTMRRKLCTQKILHCTVCYDVGLNMKLFIFYLIFLKRGLSN